MNGLEKVAGQIGTFYLRPLDLISRSWESEVMFEPQLVLERTTMDGDHFISFSYFNDWEPNYDFGKVNQKTFTKTLGLKNEFIATSSEVEGASNLRDTVR